MDPERYFKVGEKISCLAGLFGIEKLKVLRVTIL